MAESTIIGKEVQLKDGDTNIFPKTLLSSIKTDDDTTSLDVYIKGLIATALETAKKYAEDQASTAQSNAETKAAELASSAKLAAINQVKDDLGYTSDANKVTFGKTIVSDSVEGAVWNS